MLVEVLHQEELLEEECRPQEDRCTLEELRLTSLECPRVPNLSPHLDRLDNPRGDPHIRGHFRANARPCIQVN